MTKPTPILSRTNLQIVRKGHPRHLMMIISHCASSGNLLMPQSPSSLRKLIHRIPKERTGTLVVTVVAKLQWDVERANRT